MEKIYQDCLSNQAKPSDIKTCYSIESVELPRYNEKSIIFNARRNGAFSTREILLPRHDAFFFYAPFHHRDHRSSRSFSTLHVLLPPRDASIFSTPILISYG